ncbi:hydantoinase B/oxoprolinase family protein [Desulfobacula sp.]|uniref:hydantoinase B/oxoprolinase family protein n=1 Tax=Desulfobacula sp. TaxID=2593537 RepID=UPI002610AFAD|nr:hydantoinase B/oxoprolinase family protein [Desulfobacula sp.]
MMKYKADAVTMQVIRYALEAVADDMGYNLMRMGRTTIVKEIMDINCGVLAADGGILAQAHLCPLMIFSLPETAANMIRQVEKFNDGDIIISNDPYLGGQHLLDVQLFSPVIIEDKPIAFVANIAHQLDMGGAVPGGVAGGLTEIYQEGLRIPFVKLYQKGEEDPQIFSFISNNIRIPEKTMEDIRAQAATTMIGVERIKALVLKYGQDVFLKCTSMLNQYSEKKVRAFIESVPDGDYTGIDYLDDDGIVDTPVKIQLNVHIRGDEMAVDFDGSSPQTKGNVNCPWSCTKGGVFYTMVGIVDPYMALNSGTFAPIKVSSKKGLVTNPNLPAGVTARSQTMTKIVEAMLRAMSGVVPDRIVAGSHGQACTNNFSGIHPETNKRFSYIEIQGGGGGARPDKDGPDGQDLHLGRFMNTPVEAAEIEYPVMIERYEFIKDSGGAGKYRGGVSTRRDIRFLTDVTWARYSDRQKFKPLGIFGGKDGSTSSLILNPGTSEEQKCKSKGVDQIKAGDLLSICLPGSGGYGPPEERQLQAVQADVIAGKISVQSALEDYKVVLDENLNIDKTATDFLRSKKEALHEA